MQRIQVVFNGGPHPDRDLGRFRAACLKAYPNATEVDLGFLYRKAILEYDLPWKDRIFALFGQDIMTADLERHHLWPFFGGMNQRRLKAFPHDTGAMIEGESVAERYASRVKLAKRGVSGFEVVNRSVLVSPSGMQESYVFSRKTHWTQEVREDDWELICQHPSIRRKFQVFETAGPLVIPRAYSGAHVKQKDVARDMSDVQALVREHSPSKHHLSAEIPKA